MFENQLEQWEYLTSDAYTTQFEALTGSLGVKYSEYNERYKTKHGISFTDKFLTPLRIGLTSQFHPVAELVDEVRKRLELPRNHPLVQALDVYARNMAYFGKGSRALTSAGLRYYKFLGKALNKYGISRKDFGQFVLWNAAPMRNRVLLAHLDRSFNWLKADANKFYE